MSIVERIRQALEKLNAAREENRKLAQQHASGSTTWGALETIDDHLFDAIKLIDGE